MAVLTPDDGIAATIAGSNPGLNYFPRGENCTALLLVTEPDGNVTRVVIETCNFIPGSNIYLASWTCLVASIAVAAGWKAASAIKFAQGDKMLRKEDVEGEEIEGDDDDFVDASEDAI